jgi:hypothetical protein
MTRRFTGPIGKSVSPWQGGAPLLARGRVLAQQCLDRIKFGGLKQFVTSERLPDGSTIRALVINQGTGAPLIRVWIERPTGEPSFQPVLPGVIFEHGWLVLNDGASVLIGVDTVTANYYAGPGTILYGSSRQHIFDQFSLVADDICASGSAPDWREPVPTLDNNNRHVSAHVKPGQPLLPFAGTGSTGVPTGLTKLVEQGLIMARRSWFKLVPRSWLADMTRIGVQRDPEGGYWAFFAGSSLMAVKLTLHESMSCFPSLIENSISDSDRWRLESGMLGYASAAVDANGNVIPPQELISLSAAYSDGVNFYTPLAHGWHWSWQRSTDDAGAVRIGCFYDGAAGVWQTRRAEIQLTWNATVGEEPGYWSAVLLVTALGPFGQSHLAPIRIPIAQNSSLTVPLHPRGTPQAASVPFYEWSTPSGYKQAIILPIDAAGSVNEQDPWYPPGGYERNTWVSCGPGSNFWSWSQYSWTAKGGFVIDGTNYEFAAASDRSDYTRSVSITETGTETTNTFFVEAEGVWKWRGLDAGTLGCAGVWFENPDTLFYDPDVQELTEACRVRLGYAESTYTEVHTQATELYGAVAVLLGTETGVVGISGMRATGAEELETYRTTGLNEADGARLLIGGEELLEPIGRVKQNMTLRHNGAPGYYGTFVPMPFHLRVGFRIATDSTGTVIKNTASSDPFWVAGAGGLHSDIDELKTLDYVEWFSLTASELDATVPAPASFTTYGGRINWTPEFGVVERPAGYQGSAAAAPVGGI